MRVITFTLGGEAKKDDCLCLHGCARKGGRSTVGYVFKEDESLETGATQLAAQINTVWCTPLYDAKAKGEVITVKCADGADDVTFSWHCEHLIDGEFLKRKDGGEATVEIVEG